MYRFLWTTFILLTAFSIASGLRFLAESAVYTTTSNGEVVYHKPNERSRALWASIITGSMGVAVLAVIQADLDILD